MNKTNKLLVTGLVLTLITTAGAVSFAYQGQGQRGADMNKQGKNCDISSLQQEQLTSEIKNGLIFMKEEEKLARDVYLYFADLYGQRVFSNIAKSEQKHMDKVTELLTKYGIEDPVLSDQQGVFKDQTLQSLYDILTSEGSNSLESALRVGVTIEEKDIADLETELNRLTAGTDIYTVFSSLKKGSLHHLGAFIKNLERQGVNYESSYNTEIVKQGGKRGNMQSQNNKHGNGMGQRGQGNGSYGRGNR